MPTVEGFLPSTHGLHFANCWPPNTPAMTVHTPLGELTIGDASNGLCGGFCFAVHDLVKAHRQPPAALVAPPAGSPLMEYLSWRLLASWNIPAGLLTYYAWANTPDHDTLFGVRPGVGRMTIHDQLPKLMASIDGGEPCTLGLVTVHSSDPRELSHCHQVLAYGYAWHDQTVRLQVYDPNSPDDDQIFLQLDTSHPSGTTTIEHNVCIDRQIRGFFVVPYSSSDPTAIAGPQWESAPSTPEPSAPLDVR